MTILLLIALAIVCVVFWRPVLIVLAMVAIFLMASGLVLVFENLHH